MSMKTFYAQATEKNAFSALLILVSLMLLYAPAVDNSFQYDDRHSIVENPHLRALDNWPAFFVDPTLFLETQTRRCIGRSCFYRLR